MKTDIKGCSTCPVGQEQLEEFTVGSSTFIQYDYRHSDGELFSCVAADLKRARLKRDKWLKRGVYLEY